VSEPADLERILARAIELGADEAKVIDARTVVTAAWVRLKCQYGCGGYNVKRTCPPHTPTPEETQKVIDCYRRGVLVHCTGKVRPTAVVVPLEREVFLAGFYKAFGFGEGPCRLCDKCAEERCAHPREARPSMEACGIDVYATARANGWPINPVQQRGDAYNLYGLVLVD
jgi:predicted metal-binding protein